MNEIVWLVTMHGYWVLFLCVLGRQACLPIPTNLFVLAAGALAGFGKLSVIGVIAFRSRRLLLPIWLGMSSASDTAAKRSS